MPDYQKGVIYGIRCHSKPNLLYIGSTIQPLYKRFHDHKNEYKRYKNNKKKTKSTSHLIIQYEDCYIELIEKYPCNDKNELHRREGQLIREMDCVNKVITSRTKKEYREDHKERILERDRKYYYNNKNKILENKKETITCKCGSVVTKHHIKRHERSKKHQTYIRSQSN